MESKVVIDTGEQVAKGDRISFEPISEGSPNKKMVLDPTSPFTFEGSTPIPMDQEDLLRIDYTVESP